MLWTDQVFITQDDMSRIDSEVVPTAEAEQITLNGPNGLLRGAYEELTDEFQKLMISFGGYLGSGDVTPNHIAAVLNVGLGNAVRQKALPSQVVVSGDVPGQWNHVKRWGIYYALEFFFRDCYNRTVKDRYEGKMRYYKSERQRRVELTVKAKGVPICIRPLQRPAAAFEPNSGTWDGSNVSVVSSLGAVGGVFDVAITYCYVSGGGFYVNETKDGNAESSPSDVLTQTVLSDNAISVSLAGLNPPIGKQPTQQILLCVISPLPASHWNLWVGRSGTGILFLQNTLPIPISTTSYLLPGDPTLSGFKMGMGQRVERNLSLVPTRQRA